MLSKNKDEGNLQNGRKHLQIKYLIGVNTPQKYKEFTQFNSKKKKKKAKKMIQNWAEELNKHFPKKTHK